MKQALLVFVGGGFGSVSRYFLGKWLNNLETAIPIWYNAFECVRESLSRGYIGLFS